MLNLSFGYPGSKARLAKRICQFFPHHGYRYIEPFSGHANIFFKVVEHHHYQKFWLNDPLTYPFLKALEAGGDRSSAHRDAYKLGKLAKSLGHEYAHVGGIDLNVALQEAHGAWVGGFFEDGGQRKRKMKGRHPHRGFWGRCVEAADIIRENDVRITNWDYRRVLAQCDERDMVYLDPPYWSVSRPLYDAGGMKPNSSIDYAELVDTLVHAPFKWVLSEYNVGSIYAPLGPPVATWRVTRSITNAKQTNYRRLHAVECLWSNFKLQPPLEGDMNIEQMLFQLETKKAALETTIAMLRDELPRANHHKTVTAGAPRKKSHMSAAARKRISMVQKERWRKIKAAKK